MSSTQSATESLRRDLERMVIVDGSGTRYLICGSFTTYWLQDAATGDVIQVGENALRGCKLEMIPDA